MNFKEFCDYIKEHILEYFPEEYAQGLVKIDSVVKNNGVVRQGLSIFVPGCNASPHLYLEEFYARHKKGTSLDSICRKIAKTYRDNMVGNIPFTKESISDFEAVKSRITTKVVAAKTNKAMLKERPFTRLDDLAVVYQIEVDAGPEVQGSVAVSHKIFQMWQRPLSEIHKIAVENMEKMFPSRLTAIESLFFEGEEDFLSGAAYEQPDIPLLALTNEKYNRGASALANPEVLHRVSQVIRDSFYIIPSSVHEVLILPAGAVREMGQSEKELGEMVRAVNATQVEKEEQLSDHVYVYDKEKKTLETVPDSKEKTKDKEAVR